MHFSGQARISQLRTGWEEGKADAGEYQGSSFFCPLLIARAFYSEFAFVIELFHFHTELSHQVFSFDLAILITWRIAQLHHLTCNHFNMVCESQIHVGMVHT